MLPKFSAFLPTFYRSTPRHTASRQNMLFYSNIYSSKRNYAPSLQHILLHTNIYRRQTTPKWRPFLRFLLRENYFLRRPAAPPSAPPAVAPTCGRIAAFVTCIFHSNLYGSRPDLYRLYSNLYCHCPTYTGSPCLIPLPPWLIPLWP